VRSAYLVFAVVLALGVPGWLLFAAGAAGAFCEQECSVDRDDGVWVIGAIGAVFCALAAMASLCASVTGMRPFSRVAVGLIGICACLLALDAIVFAL
jgi:hypothetical protein